MARTVPGEGADLRGLIFACGVWLGLPGSALAQDFNWSGLVDARLVAPSGQSSNFDGGFGKLRWGDGRGSPVIPDLGGAILRGSATLTPDLRFVAEIRYDPRQKTAVDLIDAYVLHVYPLVLGGGKRLFPEGKRLKLKLSQSTTLPTGVVFLRYEPIR